MKFFHLSVRLTNEKPDEFVCPFDKPIKSLYFRSFVVSVSFARFHFKVIRKSLYHLDVFNVFDYAGVLGGARFSNACVGG